ncbi:MAG: peptidoglycan DD-metalloendopeptidase family protein [Caldilineaceae bacterium]
MANESYDPPASQFDQTEAHKWTPPSAESFPPEAKANKHTPPSQIDRPFVAPSFGGGEKARPFSISPEENSPVAVRFGASTLAVEPLTGADSALAILRLRIQAFLGDQISPIRLASHLAVIAVAAVVLIVSQTEMPDWQFSLRNLPEGGLFLPSQAQSTAGTEAVPLNSVSEAAETFQRAVIPFTNPQTQPVLATAQESAAAQAQPSTSGLITVREQIETYSVRSGDTVLGIAARFNLQPETLQWANPELEANPDMLRVGDRLVILPVDGVLHVVQNGDTLSKIAAKYKVTTEAIVNMPLNHLSDSSTPITLGQQLVIPGGNKPYIAPQVQAYNGPAPEGASQGSGVFAWPTSGSISQPYWNGHRAIDISAWTGTGITAADSGYVIAARTGWNGGYGTMVMIDHGGGYVTLYGHMNSIFVRQGESVVKGQQIGTVGNTGNSTGPHLHFEVRYQGVSRNPFSFLP